MAVFTGVPAGLLKFRENASIPKLVSIPLAYSASWVFQTTVACWGFPIGTPQNFQAVSFHILSHNPLFPITRVRVRIRNTNKAGAILGDTTIPVYAPPGVDTKIFVPFAAPILNVAADKIWLEYFTDGYTGYVSADATGYPTPAWPFSAAAGGFALDNPPALSDNISQSTTYVETYSLTSGQNRVGDLLQRRLAIDGPTAGYLSQRQAFAATTTLGTSDPYGGNFQFDIGNLLVVFYGWGSTVGSPTPFSAVQFWIKPWSGTEPITTVLVRLRDTNKSGAILASRTVSVSPYYNRPFKVTCDFGITITPPAGGLWLEYNTDGPTGVCTAPPVTGAEISYFVAPVPTDLLMQDFVGPTGLYAIQATFGDVVPGLAVAESSPSSTSRILFSPHKTATILVPSKLYAVEGREHNLYFKQCCRTNLSRYLPDYRVTCAKGAQYQDFYRYTPIAANAGSDNFTLDVYDDRDIVQSKTVTMVTKALTAGNGVTRKLLCIGDSTLAGGQTLAELTKLFVGDVMTLTQVGSQFKTVNDSGGTGRAIRGEAISGWTSDLFYSDTVTVYTPWQGGVATGSPFVIGGVFNFAQYLINNAIAMAADDWVLIHLGINDLFGYLSDTTVSAHLNSMTRELKAMISNIQAGVAGVRICVCLTIPPSDQNAFGAIYPNQQLYRRYLRNWEAGVMNLMAQFDTGSTGIFVNGWHLNIDTYNNFTLGDVQLNARNVVTQRIVVSPSGVHPDNPGYYQMADSLFAFLKGHET